MRPVFGRRSEIWSTTCLTSWNKRMGWSGDKHEEINKEIKKKTLFKRKWVQKVGRIEVRVENASQVRQTRSNFFSAKLLEQVEHS